jgi:hypothetical protein
MVSRDLETNIRRLQMNGTRKENQNAIAIAIANYSLLSIENYE